MHRTAPCRPFGLIFAPTLMVDDDDESVDAHDGVTPRRATKKMQMKTQISMHSYTVGGQLPSPVTNGNVHNPLKRGRARNSKHILRALARAAQSQFELKRRRRRRRRSSTFVARRRWHVARMRRRRRMAVARCVKAMGGHTSRCACAARSLDFPNVALASASAHTHTHTISTLK